MLHEAGSDAVLSLLASEARSELYISALQRVELRSSIQRQRSTGEIDEEMAEDAQCRGAEILERFTIVPVSEDILQSAASLIDNTALRSLDSIQLATALHLQAIAGEDTVVLVSSDKKLLAAAAASGLETINPAVASEDVW